eukprot:365576-Chlamydomonas_euryale.AAC.16
MVRAPPGAPPSPPLHPFPAPVPSPSSPPPPTPLPAFPVSWLGQLPLPTCSAWDCCQPFWELCGVQHGGSDAAVLYMPPCMHIHSPHLPPPTCRYACNASFVYTAVCACAPSTHSAVGVCMHRPHACRCACGPAGNAANRLVARELEVLEPMVEVLRSAAAGATGGSSGGGAVGGGCGGGAAA